MVVNLDEYRESFLGKMITIPNTVKPYFHDFVMNTGAYGMQYGGGRGYGKSWYHRYLLENGEINMKGKCDTCNRKHRSPRKNKTYTDLTGIEYETGTTTLIKNTVLTVLNQGRHYTDAVDYWQQSLYNPSMAFQNTQKVNLHICQACKYRILTNETEYILLPLDSALKGFKNGRFKRKNELATDIFYMVSIENINIEPLKKMSFDECFKKYCYPIGTVIKQNPAHFLINDQV